MPFIDCLTSQTLRNSLSQAGTYREHDLQQHLPRIRHRRRAAPSGVPPMPSRMSTGAPSLATSIAAPTSPSLISRMRTPASRHSRMMSACRGRSKMTAVTSLQHKLEPHLIPSLKYT